MSRILKLLLPALLALLPLSLARAQTDALTAGEVTQIVGQAAAEASAQGAPAVIAVTDRVGNVLAVFQMTGAPATIAIGSQRIPAAGLNGLENVPAGIIPTELGAIAKAVTGAYLSSSGNAFTTRTASQIVQEFFNVGERGQPGGPLYGVQFSSLPCSDLVISDPTLTIGPKRTPLGLSADPGGFPLYKNGFVVGGIGVIADGQYGLDLRIQDFDRNVDEVIAIAGQAGFAPPIDITAQRIAVDGKTLRYSDVSTRHILTNPALAPAPAGGAFIVVPGYHPGGAPIAGTNYGDPAGASGYRPDTAGLFPGLAPTPFVLVTPGNANRFTPKAGAAGVTAAGAASAQSLTAPEVQQILASALGVAYSGRAQIRKPLGSFIQVTVSVADATGDILGVARTPDGPVFGTDVSLQKARSAAFISNPLAAADLNAVGAQLVGGLIPVPALSTYVTQMQGFFPGALTNGVAYGARSIGNVHRPFFPDGAAFGIPGPLSNPYATWSPFNVGLQLDLVIANIVGSALGGSPPAAAPFCTPLAPQPFGGTRLANGLQIFAGGVPIFKNGDLVGAIGVSGDGIDQDDMIAFLGAHRAGQILGTGVGNAPVGQRANTLKAFGRSLRYVSCPFAPFLGSKEQDPCSGK